MEHTPHLEALERALKAVGGASALARELSITPQAVAQWKAVPPKMVLEVERITGVSRHELRVDVFGPAQRHEAAE